MVTLNYEPIVNAINKTLAATLPFPYSIHKAPEVSLGYLATNTFHIDLENLPEDFEDLNQITYALYSGIYDALKAQGLTTQVTHLNGDNYDNFIMEARDINGDLYATIHIVVWDLEVAITTTSYYL